MDSRDIRRSIPALPDSVRSGSDRTAGPCPTAFSVIMPTYNYAHAIHNAIRSVIGQTYPHWELIVVTDGCTDDTVDVVRRFGDRRLRVIVRDDHSGRPGLLRNHGISAARGDVVCYLDHDDRWMPGHLARLAGAYRNPAVRVAATGCRRVSPEGGLLGTTVPVNMAWHPELQIVSPIFEPSRVSHRRGIEEAAGGWADDDLGLEDWDLWVRLADAGESFTLLPQHSVECTLHAASRRHSLRHRYVLTFGLPVDAATARQILAVTRRADVRQELGRRYRADIAGWYRAMAASGRLRLAEGMTVDGLLAALRADAGDPAFAPHLRPWGDAFVLCRVLACRTRSHAERIVEINRTRMPRSTAYLGRLISGHAPAVGESALTSARP